MSQPSKRRPRHDSYRITSSRGYIYLDGEDGPTMSGKVTTPWGIVSVYSSGEYSSYAFAYVGRVHYLTEWRSRTGRGLAIMAGKFAKRISVSGAW